jgi:hypothetical protein
MIDVYKAAKQRCRHSRRPVYRELGVQAAVRQGRMIGSSWNAIGNAVLGGDLDRDPPRAKRQSVAIRGNNLGRSAVDNPTLARWFGHDSVHQHAGVYDSDHRPALSRRSQRLHPQYRCRYGEDLQTSIAEHVLNIQFRAECYNLFNTPQFNSPTAR